MDWTKLSRQELDACRPIPIWSWNDTLNKDELKRQIAAMAQAGFGGFFIRARAGLGTPYMSEEWMQDVELCVSEGTRHGLHPWICDENGWPSGSAGMTLLRDPQNLAHYLTLSRGEKPDPAALAVYVLDAAGSLQRLRPGAGCEAGQTVLNLYDNVTTGYVDILNPDVVRKFLGSTHEEYARRLGNRLGSEMTGFFMDEPQYYRWGTPFSPVLPAAYHRIYGEDLLDELGALLTDCRQSSRLRYRYWTLVNRMYTDSYARQVEDWCEAHRCRLSGHTVEETRLHKQMWCSAGVMPFYEYEQMPGIDWLGRDISDEISPRQVGSVAQQLGKKQVLGEMFAGAGWDATPRELKRLAEFLFVNGVNLMCQHLYAYSIRGQRKRDYPGFYSEHNPWFGQMRRFNNYFAVLGCLLSGSRESAPVGVLSPIRSAYLRYNRETDAESVARLDADYASLAERLGEAQIGHHYLDESLLERHGRVEDGRLILGQCAYTHVVVPSMENLASNTVALLREFLRQGGRLWLQSEAPHFCDGVEADLSFLRANVRFEELDCDTVRFECKSSRLRSTHRLTEDGEFVFMVNLSLDAGCDTVLCAKAEAARLYEIDSNRYYRLPCLRSGDEVHIPLHFEPGRSMVVELCSAAEAEAAEPRAFLPPVCRTEPLDAPAGMPAAPENALALDRVQLSADGINFSQPRPVMAVSDELLRRGENGRIWLKYTFTAEWLPPHVFLEAEETRNAWMINGRRVLPASRGQLDRGFGRADIAPFLYPGRNEVVLTVDYRQSQDTYRAQLDLDQNESVVNCTRYDTDVEAVYLLGGFAVRTQLEPVKPGIVRSAGNFVLTEPPSSIDPARITAEGYPFFFGDFTFTQKLTVSDTNCRLCLDGRYSEAAVSVNGRPAARLLFENECDLSPFLHPGENLLTVTLTASLRNLLGPHHYRPDPETFLASPDKFHLYGTWKDGESPLYDHDYTFVEFGAQPLLLHPLAPRRG